MYLVSYKSVFKIPDYLEEDFLTAAANKNRKRLNELALEVRQVSDSFIETPFQLEGIVFLDDSIA